MKIWIVSLYDPTEIDDTRPMRFLSLAHKSVELGNDITYFSNTFRHATKKNRFNDQTIIQHSETYKTVFIKSSKYKKNLSLGRLYSHYLYAYNLISYIDKCGASPDIIVSALPPILTNYKLAKWCKEKNIPFVIDIIDPWPEVFTRLAPKLISPIIAMFSIPFDIQVKRIIRKSSGIISISNQYIEWSKKKFNNNKKTSVFFPSIPYDFYQNEIKKYERKIDSKLKIIYAGNLGLSYDIPCILKAAEILEKQFPDKTEFVIAGLGVFEKEISNYQKSYTNVKYIGRVGQAELLKQYSESDLGLAQYTKGATQSITYKFFDYLGSGLPILNSLQSEMAFLIDQNKVGLNNEPGDFLKLAENIAFFFDANILIEYKKNALKLTKYKGDSNLVYEEYVNFLKDIFSEYNQNV
jgi:hypothetical protein